MLKWIWLVSFFLFIFSPISLAADKAVVLNLSGTLNPAADDYIKRGIDYALAQHSAAIVIQLNTPGGLESTMKSINDRIMQSPIPVIAYVYPAYSRASGMGVFVLYASHFAAMASDTTLGSALSLLGNHDNKVLSPSEVKMGEDASNYMRTLAQANNRNAAWGEQAVQQALLISDKEAKELNVINAIADNYSELLTQLNQSNLTVKGTPAQLNTTGMALIKFNPDWRYHLLNWIANPNIAYLLLLIAVYGLFLGFSKPRMILPGVIGMIALLAALYTFQILPINYSGLTLILIAMTFMVFEVYTPSYGILSLIGVITLILGSITLFEINDAAFGISKWLIVGMSLFTAAFLYRVSLIPIRHKNKFIFP